MINNYNYNKQLKKWIISFANIFTGTQVKTGLNGCGEIDTIDVPITYASKDRVVAMLGSGGTQNKQHTLPSMSCYLTNLELAPERRKGVNMVDRRTFMSQGGIFPEDLKTVRRIMPIPYNALFDLTLYASNTDQMFQMLEPIFIMFDPDIQIQKSDAPFDWTKITSVELTNIGNEENIPLETNRRVIIWTLSFSMPIWLSPPMDIKADIINKISIRMGDMSGFSLNEYDENGDLAPFADGSLFADFSLDTNSMIIEEPNIGQENPLPEHGYNTLSNQEGGIRANEFAVRRRSEEIRLSELGL